MNPRPVSAALEVEVTSELQRRGIVVWLDAGSHYAGFVDGLAARHRAGAFPYPVVGFRGSFLELLLAAEPYGNGLDPVPLLLHMPGFTEETIRATPVLELYEAGFRYRKGLDTLIREAARGKVAPETLEAFLARGPATLADADAWLEERLVEARGGIAALLQGLTPADALDAAADLLQGRESFLARQLAEAREPSEVEAFLRRQTGLDAEWLAFFGQAPGAEPLPALFAAWIGWLLSVEYVHDLSRPPLAPALARLKTLSSPLAKTCLELVARLREQHPDAYEILADEVEPHLHEELRLIQPEDLGKIDTFRREELRVLEGAIAAARAGAWDRVRAWGESRTEERSFWLKRDPARRRTWILLREAAELGAAFAAQPRPLAGARRVEEAVARYAEAGYLVDRAHRRFEQRQATLLEPQLPHFGDLKELVRQLRLAYRAWADRAAADFTAACREGGFLPETSFQQRTLFDEVVQPLAAEERTAFLLVDAFRFEMATELLDDLKGPGASVDLKARLAELPTITSVGMNALAPVQRGGRLEVAGCFDGFRTGEYTVRSPADRARAMGSRVGGRAPLFTLAEICDADPAELKRRVARDRVIVVRSSEFDDAGEAGVGPITFELSLRQLRAAVAQLQKAGVKNLVITSDHGFLLLDETTRRAPFGTRRDPKNRYVLDDHPRAEEGMVPVSLASLGYDGRDGYLLFREDTAVFSTGAAGVDFVHGGNSPAERVIPVLTVRRSRAVGTTHTAYEIEAARGLDALGARRLRVQLRTAEGQTGTLGFAAPRSVSLAIRVPGHPEVRVVMKDLTGPGAIGDGVIRLPVDAEASELFFALEGPSAEAVRIELFHPEGVERVAPRLLEERFEVDWRRGAPAVPPPAAERARALDWTDEIEDEGVRKVFVHLARHGSISEVEATRFLGSPRAMRRFSSRFEEYLRKVPFRVRIEMGETGKRYVKEGEK